MTDDLQKLTAFFDDRYVKKDVCADRHEKTDKEITEIMLKQERISTQLNFISKIGIVIMTATITLLATQIGGLIFK